jgi:acetyltransferase-like isoleucine patch superfamily enzyme
MPVRASTDRSADRPPHAVRSLRAPALALARLISGTLVVLYRLRIFSFLTSSRMLALVPGAFGIRLRRYWYERTLESCGEDLVVEWLTAMKTPKARIGARVFIGAMCWIAEVEIGNDVMIATRVAIQGGGRTHGIDRIDIPMNQQPGSVEMVVIGPDVWIGTGATVLADVAPGTVVAAGAIVISSFPAFSMLAGVPARVVRQRGNGQSNKTAHA